MPTLFRSILVPVDFSRSSLAALGTAADLARVHGGRLLVLHAMAPVYPFTTFGDASGLPPWAPPKALIDETRQHLESWVGRALKGRRLRSVTCRILIGQPHLCIVEAARDADSIVMATLGRTGLSHLVIGSVAEKVVRHAPVPVLTIHVHGRRKTTALKRSRASSRGGAVRRGSARRLRARARAKRRG